MNKTRAWLLVGIGVVAAVVIPWWFVSPHYTIANLGALNGDREANYGRLYNRDSVRQRFGAEMESDLGVAVEPLTEDVILDALVTPQSINTLVQDCQGSWQLAAIDGLPDELVDGEDSGPYMPRALSCGDWIISNRTLTAFTAEMEEEPQSHRLYIRRKGFGWVLTGVTLSHLIEENP